MTGSRAEGGLRVRAVADASDWDATVWSHPRGSIFAASPWGLYKERRGWAVSHLLVEDDAGGVLAIAQVQVRRRGPARQLYIQGGPLLTEKGERRAEAAIAALVAHLALRPLDLLNVNFEHAGSDGATLALLAQGFAPVTGAGHHTLEVDLTGGLEPVLAGMEPRWRKALRKAERAPGLEARFLDDPAERLAAFDAFTAMYAALQRRKSFTSGFDCAAYRDLAANDPHLLILDVCDGGERVLVRIAHRTRRRLTDFFTASTERAKANGAATLAVWRFVERAVEDGCEIFDCGGIDPARNRGVYDFKRGLSRSVVPSGPIWLHGRSRALAATAGLALAWR